MTSTLESGPAPSGSAAGDTAGRRITLERVSARKAARILAELKAVIRGVPELTRLYSDFINEYEDSNFLELDRAQARVRYPRRPITGPDGLPVIDPDTGDVATAPSIIDAMTEADWDAAGGRLRLPKSPTFQETLMAVFPAALELAELHVYRLLALFLMTNEDVKRYRREGTLSEVLDDRADELLDEWLADDVIELAVLCGELVDAQIIGKVDELGDRAGNALRLFGLAPAKRTPTTTAPTTTPTPTPSASRPTSSTDSPASTAEASPAPSTSPTSSSENSDDASTATSSSDEPRKPSSA